MRTSIRQSFKTRTQEFNGVAPESLLAEFQEVRKRSLVICAHLKPEVFRVQPIEEVSPPWWNLGHTSWFFAENILKACGGQWETQDKEYAFVLNSYYESLGPRLARIKRGSLSRPSTREILSYRSSVDRRVQNLLESIPEAEWENFSFLMKVGIHHEQQHQELLLTEIKYITAQTPPNLRQAYRALDAAASQGIRLRPLPEQSRFIPVEGGLFEFGHREEGWCFDNELPVHKYFLDPFLIEDRLVSNQDYFAFIEDGGYTNPLLWLENGWQKVQQEKWETPLYWEKLDGRWTIWTLTGTKAARPDEPVCHVSFYEADAFARWKSQNFTDYKGARLPTEREWEQVARSVPFVPSDYRFLESDLLHPVQTDEGDISQLFGSVWQWTSNHYEPYPGYEPFEGVLSEYNSKFMDNQRVLRGGSCVTPKDHFRVSYRNFWNAATRFQFTGVRLAKDEERRAGASF